MTDPAPARPAEPPARRPHPVPVPPPPVRVPAEVQAVGLPYRVTIPDGAEHDPDARPVPVPPADLAELWNLARKVWEANDVMRGAGPRYPSAGDLAAVPKRAAVLRTRLVAAARDAVLDLRRLTGEPIPLPPPAADLAAAERAFAEVLGLVERAADAARSADQTPAASSVRAVRGWTFEVGEAEFAGVRFDLHARLSRLLERLAEGPRRVGMHGERGLIDTAGAGDYEPLPGTVRTYLADLRKVLRAAFGLPADANPIPSRGRGVGAGWELDEEMLRCAAEKRR